MLRVNSYFIFIQFIQGVEAKNKEVEANTEAVISCVISGITTTLDSVSWTDSSDGTLTNVTDYTIDNGSYDDSSNSQTITLTVKAGVASDSSFSCVVTSDEWSETATDLKTQVTLNVFGKTGLLSYYTGWAIKIGRIWSSFKVCCFAVVES